VSVLRVLVAESAGERRLAELIENEPSTELVAVAATGRQAVALAQTVHPDAILMASTVLAGNAFDTTREIMTLAPTPVIIVIDEIGAGAERTRTKAHEAGALAAVPFPARGADLIDTVCTMAAVGLVRRRPARSGEPAQARAARHAARHGATIVAIGASTGGPAALRSIFAAMPGDLAAPVLVTQHISTGFSAGMVYWWNAAGPLRAKIAENGEPLCNGTIYVAPDERHLTVSANHTIALSDAPASGGHRPSASVMFRSAAERFGAGTFAVILSGMGRDGVDGLEYVHRLGGTVCAQDEASSAVFGMPKAAIEAGIVDVVLPLTSISRHIADAVAFS
jgi:two-component system, chemotaxis family, protein-glutamate methylesterase/glutaminase